MNVRKIKWLTILVVHEFPEELNQEYLERIIDQEVLVAGINSKNAFLLVLKSFTEKDGFGFQTKIKELVAGPNGEFVLKEISDIEFDFHEERSWTKLLIWVAKFYLAEYICLNTISHGAGFGIYSGTKEEEEVVYGKITAIPSQFVNSIESREKFSFDTTIIKDHYIVRTDDKQSSCRSLQMLWISELSNAIKSAYGSRKLDILIFNNCYMQTYENGWMLSENVKYILAAETQFFSYGFNYLAFLKRINENPFIHPDQVIKTLIPDFKKKWKLTGQGYEKRVCLSILDLTELKKLDLIFNRIASKLESLDDTSISQIINIRKARIRSMTTYPASGASKTTMTADLAHFLTTIARELRSDVQWRELADKFSEKLVKKVRKAFYMGSDLKQHDGSKKLDKYGATGISIFIPYDLKGLTRTEAMMCAYFGRTSEIEALPVEIPLMRFRKKTKWDDFISKIINHLT